MQLCAQIRWQHRIVLYMVQQQAAQMVRQVWWALVRNGPVNAVKLSKLHGLAILSHNAVIAVT